MFHFEDILYLFIFSIPLYYFWRWLYKKFISDKTKMLIATLFSTLISTPIVLKGLILLFFIYVSYYPKIDFDRAKWIAEPNKRYQMTESIIQSKMLIGKTKEDIRFRIPVWLLRFLQTRNRLTAGMSKSAFCRHKYH
jgi:hypothetical protein